MVFKTTCTWEKKLWCGLVKNNNLCFCPVICLKFILSLKLFYNSNSIQFELPYHVLNFWTNQTHPKIPIYQNFIGITSIWMIGRVVNPRPPFSLMSQGYTTNELHQIFQQKLIPDRKKEVSSKRAFKSTSSPKPKFLTQTSNQNKLNYPSRPLSPHHLRTS